MKLNEFFLFYYSLNYLSYLSTTGMSSLDFMRKMNLSKLDWADETEEEFPTLLSTLQPKSDADQPILKSKSVPIKLTTFTITFKNQPRVLKIVSKSIYDTLLRSTNLKTHDKYGSCDKRLQKEKINRVNDLMKTCYQDNDKIVYHFCIIQLNNKPPITTNEVDRNTKHPFNIKEYQSKIN